MSDNKKLNDTDLNKVSGGANSRRSSDFYDVVEFNSSSEVTFIFEVGQKVTRQGDGLSFKLTEDTISARKVEKNCFGKYIDLYQCINLSKWKGRAFFAKK